MILKSKTFDHSQEGFHSAMGVDKDLVILCRERIFFTHFANTLQSLELFADRDDAPKEMTTMTGDLKRTLEMISDPLQYEVTLIHFISFHRMATEAFAHWKFMNDSNNSSEDKLKLELLNLLKKLKSAKDNEDDADQNEEDNPHNDINVDSVMKRVDIVKKAKYDFSKYMDLVGHPIKSNHEHLNVDDILRGLFDDQADF
jgi:hypothetical protein